MQLLQVQHIWHVNFGDSKGKTMKLQLEEMEDVEQMMSNQDFYLVTSAVGVTIGVIVTFT